MRWIIGFLGFVFCKKMREFSSTVEVFSFRRRLLLLGRSSKKSVYAFLISLCLCLLAYNSAAMLFCAPISVKPAAVAFPGNATPAANFGAHLMVSRKTRNLALVVSDNEFEVRVMEFFRGNSSSSSCELRFFMTWIYTQKAFGDREKLAVSNLFKFHPDACLIIASFSLDSRNGMKILRPFVSKGLKVTAISPDFEYLFNNTPGSVWYRRLLHGGVNPGEIPLGQNLSNLLRLGFLYRFGGIYLDADVIVLRSFKGLQNVIGAQTADLSTGNWSRLNTAVMVFDESHPLIFKFIQEFALTFDGSKWGHNGPYLASRVVSRIGERAGYKNSFRVLPPAAFYPVDWSRIGRLFEGPKNSSHSKWLEAEMRRICRRSFAVHLWNRESRGLKIQRRSILQRILDDEI